MLAVNVFGEAGHKVVIEEFLAGEEASFICLCDGVHAIPFAPPKTTKPETMATKDQTLAAWAHTLQPR